MPFTIGLKSTFYYFAFEMEKVPESSVHSWMIRKVKKFGWGFSKVILFISCWSVYFCRALDVGCWLKGRGMLRRWSFIRWRSFIKVIANWNIFGMCIWFAALFCLWKYARYCIQWCMWELHFPWGNAMECNCGIAGKCSNRRFEFA